jgi:ferredoxin-type protein NapH
MSQATESLHAPSPVWMWIRRAGLIVAMLLLSAMMLLGGVGQNQDPLVLVALAVTYLFINTLFVLMVVTGRTDRYRSILFVTFAVLFVVSFIANLIEVRGSMALSQADMLQGRTPFCHMVIPMTIIPAALTRTIIFPGSILEGFASIASMFVIWIGVSLALGRGFCSWGCFFGGMDEGFSRILRKPVIRKIAGYWTYFPYAFLGVVALWSAVTLAPQYCAWFCPFKTVTEFEAVTSATVLIQTVIFVSLFAGLVVVLPLLSKRRIQCGLFCPMGAFQSFTNKVNVFDVRINKDLCNGCQKCVRACPTFSLDADSLEKGRPRMSCMKCGKCVDECPQGAISYHVKGTPNGSRPDAARMLFVFPAFLFLATFGGGMIVGGIYRILLLVTTGRMIH